MLILLATFVILMVETALASFVGLRAWHNRPAKLFVLLTVCMAILNVATFLRVEATDAPTAYAILTAVVLTLAAFDTVLLLLLSALFMPSWWEGSRPIRAIVAPYVAVGVALAIDLLGGVGFFVNGVRLVDGVYDLNVVSPAGMVLRILFASSWLVHLALLAVAFVRTGASRPLIGWLFLSIGIALVASRLPNGFEHIHGLIQSIPILSALAYAVVYTHLFVPTKVAIDLALRAMSEAVAVLDRKGQVVYANSRASTLGFQLGQLASQALLTSGASAVDVAALIESSALPNASVSRTLTLGMQRIEMQGVSFADAQGRTRGMLLMGRDITEIEERNAQLDQERMLLGTAVRQLEAQQEERAQLVATVRALSLPVIPVLEGVLVLPLVGEFDTVRADEFTATLLQGIERERARLVLIDITGVPLLDTVSAQGLLAGVRAAALLGARCVLVGVRPEIAQALVALGTSLDGLATAANLQQALWKELGSRRNGVSARV